MTAELERVELVDGQLGLFTEPEQTVTVDPYAGLSPDRRRTLRQREQVATGVHPLTGGKARPDLGNCGTCAHRILIGSSSGGGSYPKCDAYGRSTITHSAATDVRRWWPACDRYEAKP